MFKRLMALIRGFFGSFIGALEKDNPEALIENEKENLRNLLSKYNENLARSAAFVERLKRTVKTDEAKEKELSAKIKANVSVGNTQVAGQLAMQYQDLKQRLNDNRQQLEMAEANYRKLEATRDSSLKDAEMKLMKLQDKLSKTQMLEAQAEFQETAKGMLTGFGSNGDSLNRLSGMIDERHDLAAGRVRVSGGESMLEDNSGLVKQAEMDALGNAALAEFMAMNDMAGANPAPILPDSVESIPENAQRNMGPMMRE